MRGIHQQKIALEKHLEGFLSSFQATSLRKAKVYLVSNLFSSQTDCAKLLEYTQGTASLYFSRTATKAKLQ